MEARGLAELEEKTAKMYLLNPYSGEWIKGLRIVMAEMGLIDFDGKVPRTKDIFQGLGDKDKRRAYIISRLAFVSSFIELAGYSQVPLFRGVSSERQPFEKPRTLLSASFSPDVAREFASIDRNDEVLYS